MKNYDKKLTAMKEECLNALLLLFVHKDMISLDFDAVIDDYAKRNSLQCRDLSSLLVGHVNSMGSLRE